MAGNESTITGWQEVSRMLRDLPVEIQHKAVRGGLKRGMFLVREEARRILGARTGALASKLTFVLPKNQKPGEIRGALGVAKGEFYVRADGKFDRKLKLGVQYRITVRRGAARLVRVHPRRYAHLQEFGSKNNPPKAFMRRAAAAKAGAVLEEVEKAVKRTLKKAARK